MTPRAASIKPRQPIYPKLVHGKLADGQVGAADRITLGVYYITPWIRWKRPEGLPQQAVLVDFTGSRFYFFGIQLWPQEVYFITGLLVIAAALALFLTTALFGRLWCGYACPQTVWTDLFIVVERLFEGDRNARMRLDAAPWSFDKALAQDGQAPCLARHRLWHRRRLDLLFPRCADPDPHVLDRGGARDRLRVVRPADGYDLHLRWMDA